MIVLMNNALRFCIALIYDPFYFLIDHTGNILTVTPGSMGKISSDENFIAVIVVIDQSDFLRHTELRYHGFRNTSRLFNILRSSCRNIIKNDFFRNTAAKCHCDVLQHLAFCIEHFVLLRKRHRISAGTSGRNDRYTVHRSHVRKDMEQNCMTCLVESCDSSFFFRNNTALFLCSDSDFDKCFLDVFLL